LLKKSHHSLYILSQNTNFVHSFFDKFFTSSPFTAVHRRPVNATAYAHFKLPAAMGHMLWPQNDAGP